jgi:hypothetical protein
MKYITLIIGLLVMGCGTPAENTTKTKPVKEPTAAEKKVARILGGIIVEMINLHGEMKLERKLIGEYEFKKGGEISRIVLLETGIVEVYENGKKEEELKWSISKEGEIHITDGSATIDIIRINTKDNLGTSPVSSITGIAYINDGKREELLKEEQITLKKIK